MKKIAYIEFNLVHDEIQPVFYYIANKLNYEMDFYIPEINSKRDVFCKCKNVNVFIIDYKNPHNPINSPSLPIEKKWETYDLIIMGTGEPYDRIQKFLSIKNNNKSMIIHNYHKKYDTLPFKTILLANFIKKKLNAINSIVINPFYCGEISIDQKSNSKIFCVQGNFHSKKRNYKSLIEAVLKLKHDGLTPNNFKIEIIGRYNHKDIKWHNFGTEGESFEKIIIRLKIDNYFNRPNKEYMYSEYLDKMINSRYILPLIDNTHSHKFFQNSCTSSINLGIACLCIPVINKQLANLYNINFGYHYENNDLYSAMKKAISCKNDNEVLYKLVNYKNKHLNKSVNEFKKLF
jgi:hypothetical protein